MGASRFFRQGKKGEISKIFVKQTTKKKKRKQPSQECGEGDPPGGPFQKGVGAPFTT